VPVAAKVHAIARACERGDKHGAWPRVVKYGFCRNEPNLIRDGNAYAVTLILRKGSSGTQLGVGPLDGTVEVI